MLLLANKQQAVIQISQKRETLVISVVQTRFLLLSVFMIVFMGHDFEVVVSVSCSILVSVSLPDVRVLGNHLRLTGKHQDPARSARTTPAYKGVYLFLNNMLLQGRSVGKESACNAGDLGSIPGVGRCSGEGNGNPLQYSCLENPMDRGVWWAIVHGITKN